MVWGVGGRLSVGYLYTGRRFTLFTFFRISYRIYIHRYTYTYRQTAFPSFSSLKTKPKREREASRDGFGIRGRERGLSVCLSRYVGSLT